MPIQIHMEPVRPQPVFNWTRFNSGEVDAPHRELRQRGHQGPRLVPQSKHHRGPVHPGGRRRHPGRPHHHKPGAGPGHVRNVLRNHGQVKQLRRPGRGCRKVGPTVGHDLRRSRIGGCGHEGVLPNGVGKPGFHLLVGHRMGGNRSDPG